jgi:hypothetical protein
MSTVLQFQIAGEPDAEAVEDDVTLALYATECVFGKARVRLETAFTVDDDGRSAVVESSGEAGEVAARILAGLLAARFGEAGYTVRRLEPAATAS